MDSHEQWQRQLDAELDGELSLAERAALARHLAGCPHCAGARASLLEVRAAAASAGGDPHAHVLAPGPALRGRALQIVVATAVLAAALAGWAAHARWGGPGGDLESSRAAIVVP